MTVIFPVNFNHVNLTEPQPWQWQTSHVSNILVICHMLNGHYTTFSSLIDHSKRFTLQVTLSNTHTLSYIYTKHIFYDRHHSYTAGTAIRGDSGFSVMLKDTLAFRLEEPGIKQPNLLVTGCKQHFLIIMVHNLTFLQKVMMVRFYMVASCWSCRSELVVLF